MTYTVLRTEAAVFSVSLIANTVDYVKVSTASGVELTGDATTYNNTTVAEKRFEAQVKQLIDQGAVRVVSDPLGASLSYEGPTLGLDDLDTNDTEEVSVSEPTGPKPKEVVLGSGRLARTIPVVPAKPENVTPTGALAVNGYRVEFGTVNGTKQQAWVVEE